MGRSRTFFFIAAAFVILLIALLTGVLRTDPPVLSGKLTVTCPELSGDIFRFKAGSFDIALYDLGPNEPRLVITSHEDPTRQWLWHTGQGQAFVHAARGEETVEEVRGSFFFSDRLSQTCVDQTIEAIRQLDDKSVSLTGKLACSSGQPVDYTLLFTSASQNQLGFSLSYSDPAINRAYLSYATDSDEHFFGFGEQFSYFDHKGQRVPIWISEQGIGRGQQPLTFLVNLVSRAGGNPYTTYAAVPHYITSRLRSLFLENSEYAVFDLREPDRVQVQVFSGSLRGRILYGANPGALVREYTEYAGRMRPLPDWILEGAVVGMQGGTQAVRQVRDQLAALDAPVAAYWLQDWVGQRVTSFGRQLWWNWELDEERYPEWDALVADLQADGAKVLLYTSPFLADVTGGENPKPNVKRDLFTEAEQAGYLVKRPDGSPYLVQNTDFSAGMVDFTHPQAREWYQRVLEDQLIAVGASGWMADFGEALPYDAALYDGSTGREVHNRYPEMWAQLNRAVLETQPGGDQMVFFNRAASPRSPAYATLFWEGDQLVNWEMHDGIKSAVTGLLSGGLSGFSLNHSDIGGYTTLNNPLAKVHRSKELLLRWMEFSAFSTIYRTHEGNLPAQNSQFYSDEETLTHFTRMARVYSAWAPLRKRLVQEASQNGMPVARHLFLHYPLDPQVYQLSYQEYLLGPDILVAPVLDPGKTDVRVYLPAGNWVHVWSGKPYRSPYKGQWVTVPAPLGKPGLFYKEGTEDGEDLVDNLRQAGLLP